MTPQEVLVWMPEWADQDIIVSGRLPGLSNQSYLVTVGGQKFVIRKNNPALGVDRKFEAKVMWFAAAANVSPQAVRATDDVLVTPWLAADPMTLEDARQDRYLAEVAAKFKHIHSWQIKGPVLNPFAAAQSYVSSSALPSERHNDLLLEVESAQTSLATMNRPRGLCHNDPVHSNWLKDDALLLLDWEYAALGDPVLDLAMFCYYHTLDMQSLNHLMRAYFGEPTDQDFEAFRLNLIVARGLCQLWQVANPSQSDQTA